MLFAIKDTIESLIWNFVSDDKELRPSGGLIQYLNLNQSRTPSYGRPGKQLTMARTIQYCSCI